MKLYTSKHIYIPVKYRRPEREILIPSRDGEELLFLTAEDYKKENKYMRLLIDMDRNYAQRLDIKYAMEQTNTSRSSFCAGFKEFTGDTFNNYLTRLRLYKIVYLLYNSTISIEQIGYKCGIVTSSNFRKILKEAYGRNARELRVKS